MNALKTLLMVGMVALGLQKANAVILSSGTLNEAIPDENWTGNHWILSGGGGLEISSVTVTLNITGGYAGDLYAYLVHDNYTAVLINRIGTDGSNPFGNTSPGMNVIFSSSAGGSIHWAPNVPGQIIGTYLPDGGNLSGFAGHSSSGEWVLFIADQSRGGQATLDSWSLEITEVPEPVNVALGVFGGGFALFQGARLYKRRKSRAEVE